MVQESFSLTVLPVSVSASQPFHVSLHIGPTLVPDGQGAVLDEFPVFKSWSRWLQRASIILMNETRRPIASTALLDAIDPALWEEVFPGDTPVRTPLTDTFEGRRWDTFPVKAVHDIARAASLLSLAESPVDAPMPFTSILGKAMLSHVLGKDYEKLVETAEKRGVDVLHIIAAQLDDYDETIFARRLDDYIAKVTGGNGAVKPPRLPNFETMLAQLHQARRFYERPDLSAADQYRERPDGQSGWRPQTPDPDFHERVAHLADVPELLRRLGLVIDLRVTDLAALGKAKSLQARIEIDGAADEPALTPVIRSGSNLLAKPAGDDWLAGRLKLGDADRYAAMIVDGDGSALKLDRFLWSLPRMTRVQAYGDAINAAPPALRAEGYTVVRTDKLAAVQTQVERARAHGARRASGRQVSLSAEDITRGYRIEVWDATVTRWFGLHERLVDIDVAGAGTVFSDLRSTGYIGGSNVTETPGVTDPKLKLHESLFGWSGWSLSAERPGPRVRHDDGREIVEDAASDPSGVTPVTIRARAAPGTLPWLRYGRSYAFRAWAVDLAGNSPPHAPVVGGDAPDSAPTGAAATALGKAVDRTLGARKAGGAPVAWAALRSTMPKPAAITPLSFAKQTARKVVAGIGSIAEITGVESVDRLVTARLARRAQARVFAPTRRAMVEQAARPLLTETSLDGPPVWTTEKFAPLAQAETLYGFTLDLPQLIDIAAETVTPLMPFLRWEPVLPPVIVSRHRMSEAESAHHLVIRSGVEAGMDGAAPEITPPEDYAQQTKAAHPELSLDWRGTSERHLAPPKSSQIACELHGCFDAALGTADPAIRRQWLATALRDDGTLLDVDVVDLTDPAVRHAQPGIALEAGPSVTGERHDLATITRGQELTPGEYVVHDVDQLALPYLPDPLAAGITMRFPDAGRTLPLPPLLNVESMRTDYAGEWPAAEPYRLTLAGGDALDGRVDGNHITIAVPPGEKLRLRLSSALRRSELALLGIWHAFPDAFKNNDLLAEAAADGWLWALTPTETVTLVHAVPRPVEPPVPAALTSLRLKGDTGAFLVGIINCHAPSTDRIDAETYWTEYLDDPAQAAPVTEQRRGIACSIAIGEDEDPVVIGPFDLQAEIPGLGPVTSHLVRHELGDTRHRMIDYRFRATTRFQEYFHPALIAHPDARSIIGPVTRLSVRSSARPAPPVVHSVLPLFRWEEGTEPDQPFAMRHRRRAGFRIYLERPWFSSGEGELLGLILSDNEKAARHASQWGADPLWLQKGPADRALGLTVEDFWSAAGFDDNPGPHPRVIPLANVPLAEAGIDVGVLGYKPEYQASRGMWFVDVAITPAAAYWPFVRLSVARYQPQSLPGLELSSSVTCDFAQLTPERMAVVSRPDANTVRMTVSGPIGLRGRSERATAFSSSSVSSNEAIAALIALNHRVIARLERRDPEINSDLGWVTERITELAATGLDEDANVAWLGKLELVDALSPARPGENEAWRVTIEEWEGIEADPQPFTLDGALPTAWRLIYADRFAL